MRLLHLGMRDILTLIFIVLTALLTGERVSAETVTFAQFLEAGKGGNEFSYSISSGGASFVTKNPSNGSMSVPVSFTFFGIDQASLPADLQGPQTALMTLSITTTQKPTVSGKFFHQGLSSGSVPNGLMTFTRTTPDAELHETNLLTVHFDARVGGLSGMSKGRTATLTADNGFDNVLFSSSYLKFDDSAEENLALSFTSATPCFSQNVNVQELKGLCTPVGSSLFEFLHPFTAAGTGTFAAGSQFRSVFAIPEPSSFRFTSLVALLASLLVAVSTLIKQK
jgi:hypothetical protein